MSESSASIYDLPTAFFKAMRIRDSLHVLRRGHHLMLVIHDDYGAHWVCTCDREFPLAMSPDLHEWLTEMRN